MQAVFLAHCGSQCRDCTLAQIMSAVALAAEWRAFRSVVLVATGINPRQRLPAALTANAVACDRINLAHVLPKPPKLAADRLERPESAQPYGSATESRMAP